MSGCCRLSPWRDYNNNHSYIMSDTYHRSLIMPEDTYLEEDCDPFAELGGEEGVESLFDETIITRRQPPQRTLRPARHWGIPDFTDQCNGINSFVLRPEDCEDEGGVKIQLEHRRHSTGSDLWDAALVLAHALSRQHIIARTATRTDSLGSDSGNDDSHHQIIMLSDTLRNLNVLELGSGTGALGLYCAKCLGAKHVILTDLPDNLELLERNRQANNLQHKTSVLALNWEDQYLPALLTMNNEATFDILLGTDLLLPFAVHLLDPLARTIRDLLEFSAKRKKDSKMIAPSQALICYEERFDPSPFFMSANKYNMSVERVDNSLLHPEYQDPGVIHLLRITLKELR